MLKDECLCISLLCNMSHRTTNIFSQQIAINFKTDDIVKCMLHFKLYGKTGRCLTCSSIVTTYIYKMCINLE